MVTQLTSAMIGISSHSSTGVNIAAGDVLDLNIIVPEPSVVFFIFNTPDQAEVSFDIAFQPSDADGDEWSEMIEPRRCSALQGEFEVPRNCRLPSTHHVHVQLLIYFPSRTLDSCLALNTGFCCHW